MKKTMMAIITLPIGGLLLLLGLLDYSDLQKTLQAENKAEYTGILAEFHCSAERRQHAVKLRLEQHPSSAWFHSSKAQLSFVASHSKILRLSIDNQLIYQLQDWRTDQLKNAIGSSVAGVLLGCLGGYLLYRQRQQRRPSSPESR